jgi:hypothetical protein
MLERVLLGLLGLSFVVNALMFVEVRSSRENDKRLPSPRHAAEELVRYAADVRVSCLMFNRVFDLARRFEQQQLAKDPDRGTPVSDQVQFLRQLQSTEQSLCEGLARASRAIDRATNQHA